MYYNTLILETYVSNIKPHCLQISILFVINLIYPKYL